MKFTPYDKNDIRKGCYTRTDNMKIIEEFVNSGFDCVKVEGWTTKTADSCTTSLNTSIKRMNKAGIKAITRNGEVFLIKLTGDE